jgi:outer membrane protein insertion porin family
MGRRYTYILLLIIFITSCNVRKMLPPGEKLYNGASITVQKEDGVKASSRSLRKQLQGISVPKKNKMILGVPYKVWWWYKIGEPKQQKGFKYWLRNRLGEEPVLSSRVRPAENAANMKAYLQNEGYFESSVRGDSTIKGYKLKAFYKARVTHPYSYSKIEWRADSGQLYQDIRIIEGNTSSLLRPGDRFSLGKIKTERDRIDQQLKLKGYYYFNPEYIRAFADTNYNDHTLALYLTIRPTAPPRAWFPQRIENIIVFPNYTLINPPPDTSLANLKPIDGIFVRDTVRRFKPSLFSENITYRAGDLYNLTEQNKTLNRFINLGTFRFVKNRYEPGSGSDSAGKLNVYYYLTPTRQKNIQVEVGGFSKSNSFTGGQVNLNWRHRNLFKKAENFLVKTYGAFEVSLSDSLEKNNNWRAGAELSLILPRFYLPFRVSGKPSYPPRTRILLGYEWLRRQQLYSKNFFRLQYELNWKESVSKEHTIAPVSIIYNDTRNVSETFTSVLAANPSLRYVNFPEIIASSFYNYLGASVFSNGRNIYYLSGDAEIAGNILGLFRKAEEPFSSKIYNAYFAQYAKLNIEVRYTRKLDEDLYWANRVIVGAGFPYGNSAFLPFSKQFIIGGAKSLRGFRPRAIGPGAARATAIQQAYLPQVGGDYKLEMNTELRIPISKRIKTAVFVDAGNIWTKDSTLYGPAAEFSKDFMKELAINTGVGLRLDLGILIFCFDLGFPLSKPWLPQGERWVGNNIQFGQPEWRRDNLVFNIAIGYPF